MTAEKPASVIPNSTNSSALFDSSTQSSSSVRVPRLKKDGYRAVSKRTSSAAKSGDSKDKKKPVVACIACRKKKIKCSSDRPACSNCLRLNILCEYPAIRNRGSRFGYMEMLNRRLNHLEKYINCSTNPDYHPQFVKIHQKIKNSEFESNSDSKEPLQDDQSGNQIPTVISSKNISEQISQLEPNVPQMHPASPPLPLNDTTIVDSIKLPPMEIIIHLVELYFRHVHGQTYSFIHKPSLIPRIYKNQVNKGLVLALCGLTARFSRHPAIASPVPYLAGESFVSQARQIISLEFDDPTLETVQAMILLIQHDFFRAKGKKSMIYISMAIRMATTLGLHEESPDPSLTFLEREQRRRTYWSLVVLDRLGHSASHWHVQLRADIVDIQMPCTDYCFENSIPVVTQKLNGDPPPRIKLADGSEYSEYPTGKLGLYAYIVKATILWCDINKYVMEGYRHEKVPPWEPGSKFSQLEISLQNLFAELPQEYQYSRERLIALDTVNQGGALVHLHGELLVSLCYLNRVIYPYNYKKMSFDAEPSPSFIERAAINIMASAKAQSSMIEDVLTMEDFHMAPFMGFGVFAVSSVHIANCFSTDPVVSSAAKNNLAINLKFLVKMREYWYSVGVWCIILKDRYFQKARRYNLRMQQLNGSMQKINGNDINDDIGSKYKNQKGSNNDGDSDGENRIIPDGFSRPGTPPLAYAPDDLINVAANKSQLSDMPGYTSASHLSSMVSNILKNNRSQELEATDSSKLAEGSEGAETSQPKSFSSGPTDIKLEDLDLEVGENRKATIKDTVTPHTSGFSRSWSNSSNQKYSGNEIGSSKRAKLSNNSNILFNIDGPSSSLNSDIVPEDQFSEMLAIQDTNPLMVQSKNGFDYTDNLENDKSIDSNITEKEYSNTFTDVNDDANGPAVTGMSVISRNNLLTDTSEEWLNAIDPSDFQQLIDNKSLDDHTLIGWVNNDVSSSLANNNLNGNAYLALPQQRLQQLVFQGYHNQDLDAQGDSNDEQSRKLHERDLEEEGSSQKPFSQVNGSKKLRTVLQCNLRDLRGVDESLFRNSILHQPFTPDITTPSSFNTTATTDNSPVNLISSSDKYSLQQSRQGSQELLLIDGDNNSNVDKKPVMPTSNSDPLKPSALSLNSASASNSMKNSAASVTKNKLSADQFNHQSAKISLPTQSNEFGQGQQQMRNFYSKQDDDINFDLFDPHFGKILQNLEPNNQNPKSIDGPHSNTTHTNNIVESPYPAFLESSNVSNLSAGTTTLLDEMFRQVAQTQNGESDELSGSTNELFATEDLELSD